MPGSYREWFLLKVTGFLNHTKKTTGSVLVTSVVHNLKENK